jgi:hypothetical protein
MSIFTFLKKILRKIKEFKSFVKRKISGKKESTVMTAKERMDILSSDSPKKRGRPKKVK